MGQLWQIIADSSTLHLWAPAVQRVDRFDHQGERVGSTRVCRASLAGRSGTIVERVADIDEGRSITYEVDDDTFGMTRMFADYAFRLSLSAESTGTRITSETFYSPRNIFFGLLNALFLRRQFEGVVDGILRGLSAYAAQRPQRR